MPLGKKQTYERAHGADRRRKAKKEKIDLSRSRHLMGVDGTGDAAINPGWVIDCLEAGREAVTLNRDLVLASGECGCIGCLAVFPASLVTRWTDGSRRFGRTAVCPYCGADAVLPDAADFSLTPLFLQAMQARWCRSGPLTGRCAPRSGRCE